VTPVEQTRYGKSQGNCLTACVASILDVPISSLPEFCDGNGNWFHLLHEFCITNGFCLMYWRHREDTPILCLGSYVIVLLKLEGEDDMHAVVGKASLKNQEPVNERSDGQAEEDFEASEMIGSPPNATRWEWQTQIAHDPNTRGYPPVESIYGYIFIGKQ